MLKSMPNASNKSLKSNRMTYLNSRSRQLSRLLSRRGLRSSLVESMRTEGNRKRMRGSELQSKSRERSKGKRKWKTKLSKTLESLRSKRLLLPSVERSSRPERGCV